MNQRPDSTGTHITNLLTSLPSQRFLPFSKTSALPFPSKISHFTSIQEPQSISHLKNWTSSHFSTLARDSQIITHFDEVTCWITNKSTSATIAHESLLPKKNLYSLDLLSPHAEHALTLSHSPDLATWHRCLGHTNYHAVKEMAKSGLIPGMPTNFPPGNPPKCEFCVVGKQTKTPVPKTHQEGPGHKATRVLEKVWVDLSGQQLRSRTRNEYVMDIVDDYTSHTILFQN